MSVSVKWEGLEEFRANLHNMPKELTDEAGDIVVSTASEARVQIQTAYPTGPTGNLKRGVTMRRNVSPPIASAIVKSQARHASIFENGSVFRRTRRGANRGQMPQAPFTQRMIPIVIRLRRQMIGKLIAMVERHGFIVRREAA